MRTFRIRYKESSESRIVCLKTLFKTLAGMRGELLRRGCLLFTDSNVNALYGAQFSEQLAGVPVHVMPAGEENKREDVLFSLLRAMSGAGLMRGSALIAFGGGVVCDVGGLAAGLYMRGIDCILAPTTLLAQVDASVGGKTAIDFGGIKNLVGAFRQPALVFADPVFFKTLPPRELRCGLGEIVKHGALDAPLFERLWQQRGDLFDLGFLERIVPDNIAFKASVVRRDPYEENLRKCLNLGHTTAHAIEPGSNLSHGECVLLGLLFEGKLALRHTSCDEAFEERLFSLCRAALGELPALPGLKEAARLALSDKKNTSAGEVTLTVPTALGKYELLRLPFEEYARELGELWEEL